MRDYYLILFTFAFAPSRHCVKIIFGENYGNQSRTFRDLAVSEMQIEG
jgi:hypothetical protein